MCTLASICKHANLSVSSIKVGFEKELNLRKIRIACVQHKQGMLQTLPTLCLKLSSMTRHMCHLQPTLHTHWGMLGGSHSGSPGGAGLDHFSIFGAA
jgi:hypothetical protein